MHFHDLFISFYIQISSLTENEKKKTVQPINFHFLNGQLSDRQKRLHRVGYSDDIAHFRLSQPTPES